MSELFSPYTMRGLTLANRTVVSPMCEYSAVDGNAQDWHLMHLGQFATSGVGLVITEAAAVEPRRRITPQCLGLYNDDNEEALARVVSFAVNTAARRWAYSWRTQVAKRLRIVRGKVAILWRAMRAPGRRLGRPPIRLPDWHTPSAMSVAELAESGRHLSPQRSELSASALT